MEVASKVRKIAGVVVLYYPGAQVLDNIKSYLHQVDFLFAVDNSDSGGTTVADRISVIDRVHYIRNNRNLGIAKALNIAAASALEQGYEYLLTMDQDSRPAPDMVAQMLLSLSCDDSSRIGIISPFHVTRNVPPPVRGGERETLIAMTSGNLLNLEAYKTVGPFRDDLFIDYVDHEYCLRLHRKGFKVVETSSALLEHGLGDIVTYDFGIKRFSVTNHSPFRRYFMTRNRFFVMHEYKEEREYCREQLKEFFFDLSRILFLENDKFKKMHMILKGYLDYKRGMFGPGIAS